MNKVTTVTLPNGHIIGYAEYGTPTGLPVIALHGMPNTHLMWKGIDQAARDGNIRLIAPDRAGYGYSTCGLPPTLIDYADDIRGLADALGLGKFVIMGASGGGPYAYACACKLADRLLTAVILSSMPPLFQTRYAAQMESMNRLVFRLGKISPVLTSFLLTTMLRTSLPSMRKHAQQHTSPSPDIPPAVFAVLTEDLTEVVRSSRKGIASDLRLYWRAWGFNFEDIPTRVLLWHGEADTLSPIAAAHQIAAHLPNCEPHFCPNEGHVEPLTKHIEEVFGRLNEVAAVMQPSDSRITA